MSLTENITVADIYDMQPGQVFACRLEPPFRRAILRVLTPADPIVIGGLYVMAVDGEAQCGVVVRMLGEITGFYVVDEFSGEVWGIARVPVPPWCQASASHPASAY